MKLAEARLKDSPSLRSAVVALADDPSPRVRFQAAFTLGVMDTPEAVAALAKLARRADNDSWTQTAILSSASMCAGRLLETLAREKEVSLPMLRQLAALVGTSGGDAELGRALALLGDVGKEPTPLQLALLDGIGQGLAAGSRSLAALWEKPPAGLAESVRKAKVLFEKAGEAALDEKRGPEQRAASVALLGRGPFAPLAAAAPNLLSPRSPPEVQLAAVRALSAHPRPEVSALLLEAWPAAGPTLRREMTEALFARKERLVALVTALEKKQILALQIDPQRLARLRNHADQALRARAVKVLAGQVAPERGKVIEAYRAALGLKPDVANGKAVFKKQCATCHRLEDVGVQVGADLLAALRNKSAEALLIDVLDPSREVDPRFLAYQVTTKRGQVLSGVIAAETAASLTLKRGEGAEDTVLRTQIEAVESTGKSLMPEGLEAQITKQEMADLITYLMKIGAGK
ncbi:MAG: HEAT repeat domain-containing protein [Gemmataceae bacterium]